MTAVFGTYGWLRWLSPIRRLTFTAGSTSYNLPLTVNPTGWTLFICDNSPCRGFYVMWSSLRQQGMTQFSMDCLIGSSGDDQHGPMLTDCAFEWHLLRCLTQTGMAEHFWITFICKYFIWIQICQGVTLCKTGKAAALQPVNKVLIDELNLHLLVCPILSSWNWSCVMSQRV